MILAEIDDPRMLERDNPTMPVVSVQRVRIEFDVMTQYSLPVLQSMLAHLNDELTRPVAEFNTMMDDVRRRGVEVSDEA